MAKRKLIKRNYLGEGYVHIFTHKVTGKELIVPTTLEEYELITGKGGWKHNPTRNGYVWSHSLAGTIKVDTPNTMLGADEYTEVAGEKHTTHEDKDGLFYGKFKRGVISDAGEIDEQEIEKERIKQRKV